MKRKKIDEALLERRVLLLDGDIDREKVDKLRFGLVALNCKSTEEEIKLVVDSPGGDIQPASWLYDCMQVMSAPVTGIVNGRCESAAFYPLLGCSKRLATAHSQFFLHLPARTVKIALNADFDRKVAIEKKEAIGILKRLEQLLAERSGQSLEKIRELMREGEELQRIIFAQEAKDLGFIDEVIVKYDVLTSRR